MNNQPKSIGVNYIYNLAYQILVLVVPFILTPYVSRVLSPEGYKENLVMLQQLSAILCWLETWVWPHMDN